MSHDNYSPTNAPVAFLNEERGSMMVANMFCLMLVSLLIVMTINTSSITSQKIRRQNASDAVAQSTGVCLARGMNAVTTTNHLIGEMLALVVLHDAFGGRRLDNDTQAYNTSGSRPNRSRHARIGSTIVVANGSLQFAFEAAGSGGLFPEHPRAEWKEQLKEGRSRRLSHHEEATLLDSKMNLKTSMTLVYVGYKVARKLQSMGHVFAAIGAALEGLMLVIETKIQSENQLLDAIEGICRSLRGPKTVLRDEIIPSAYQHTLQIQRRTPEIAANAAAKIAHLNKCESMLFPRFDAIRLPLMVDPMSVDDGDSDSDFFPQTHQLVPADRPRCNCPTTSGRRRQLKARKVSQLARATFPWVNYHRETLAGFFDNTLHFAGTGNLYRHWTTQYTKLNVLDLQDETGPHIGLLVVDGCQAPDKGYESWNRREYSWRTDQLFTVMSVVRQDAPSIVGSPLFRKRFRDGTYSWSMALLYNGNDQERPEYRINPRCNRVVPIRQANVGMDTLNWLSGSRQESNRCRVENGEVDPGRRDGENRPFELVGRGLPGQYPRTRVNWQSKLVPVTPYRMNGLLNSNLPSRFQALRRQIGDSLPTTMNTH